MKKMIAALLTSAMITSLCVPVFAADSPEAMETEVYDPETAAAVDDEEDLSTNYLDSYTPIDVFDLLEERDAAASDTTEQAFNGFERITEMLAWAAGINATAEQRADLENCLNVLTLSREDETVGLYSKYGLSALEVFRVITIIARETDPQGAYEADIQAITDDYDAQDENIETGTGQAVNALLHSVQMLGLASQICVSGNEDFQNQIQEGLQQFTEEFSAGEDEEAQGVVSAKWLFKMLGAFVKIQNMNNADAIDALKADVEQQAENAASPSQELVYWLYGAVHAASGLTGTITQ